jgi:hypothetical protein
MRPEWLCTYPTMTTASIEGIDRPRITRATVTTTPATAASPTI